MQLNATFFAQVINFAIVYWFLNKFMFKPVLVFLQNKKEKENKLKSKLAKKEEWLLCLEETKQKELRDFQQKTAQQYEFAPVSTPEIPTQVAYKVDKKEAKKLIDLAKEILVERVPHVD